MSKTLARLEELGIFPESDMVAASISAVMELLTSTRDGNKYLVDILGMDREDGETDKEYHLIDTETRVTGGGIQFIKGTMIGGMFVPITHIDEYPIDKNTCDSCGVNSHCVEKAYDNNKDVVERCNQCMSGDPELSDYSKGTSHCEDCSVTSCPHHPFKEHYHSA